MNIFARSTPTPAHTHALRLSASDTGSLASSSNSKGLNLTDHENGKNDDKDQPPEGHQSSEYSDDEYLSQYSEEDDDDDDHSGSGSLSPITIPSPDSAHVQKEAPPTKSKSKLATGKHTRGRPQLQINTSHLFASSPSSIIPSNARAWYDYDLSVVVALVSPIGNWLTGGDHVKNVLLTVLLIFYLHQIIEGTLPSLCSAYYH